jgi:hypothetical protein
MVIFTSQACATARRPLVDIHIYDDEKEMRSKDGTSVPSEDAFISFVTEAAVCADRPAHSVVHTSYGTYKTTRVKGSKVESKWLTSKSRDVDDITLCTQLDRNRLEMLRGQCQAWNGPLSAAVYQPLVRNRVRSNEESLHSVKKELQRLFEETERNPNGCALDIVLLSEMRYEDEVWAYPYNSNRNQAIARARTRLILLLDVDFLPSKGLREAALTPGTWEAMLTATHDEKKVFVLPAFETRQNMKLEDGAELAAQASAASKDELRDMFEAADIVQFAPFFARGHGATNYTQWFESSQPYTVIPEVGYEPFILLSRIDVPWFDERFRGYGWDKITHIYQLNHTGFQFAVHPSAWVAHRPHAPSAAYSKTFTGPAYTRKHRPTEELKKLDAVAKDFMTAIKKKKYPTRGVTVLEDCRPLNLLDATRESDNDSPYKLV